VTGPGSGGGIRLSEIGHRSHRYFNPVPAEVFEEILELLPADPSWRVADLACGRAEFLVRLSERYGTSGIGVDRSAHHIDEARRRAAEADATVELIVADARDVQLEPESYEIAICVGAESIFDTPCGTLAHIMSLTTPGGVVMFGASYWRERPSSELLDLLGTDDDWAADYAGTIARGTSLGLEPIYARTAGQDAIDAYEWLYRYSVHEWLRENPDHSDRDKVVEANAAGLERFLKGGREALGFGVFMFRRR
jgi:SAM-dependent methyltransferase